MMLKTSVYCKFVTECSTYRLLFGQIPNHYTVKWQSRFYDVFFFLLLLDWLLIFQTKTLLHLYCGSKIFTINFFYILNISFINASLDKYTCHCYVHLRFCCQFKNVNERRKLVRKILYTVVCHNLVFHLIYV